MSQILLDWKRNELVNQRKWCILVERLDYVSSYTLSLQLQALLWLLILWLCNIASSVTLAKYLYTHIHTHTHKLCQTLNLYLDISFSSELPAHLYSGSARKKHTNSLSLTHFLMHMLNFRHTGGSLHNVWMWGCPARGDGGEADVLSALLHLPVLSWWGESPAEERGRRREGREAEAWRRLWGASHWHAENSGRN